MSVFTSVLLLGGFPHIIQPALINVVRPVKLVFAVGDALNLQPHRRDHIELGTEGFGHVIAVIVPLKYHNEDAFNKGGHIVN